MFARTERLLLRPGWAEDARALTAAIGDPAILRNLASAPCPYRQADAKAFLATERCADEPTLLIFRRTRGAPQLAGCIGLARLPDGNHELGYWIARPFWGLGFATEAGHAMVEIARDALRLEHLVSGHFLDNPASGNVLAKLGFGVTGEVVPRFSVGRGELAPCRMMTLDLRRQVRPRMHQAEPFARLSALAA